MGIWDSGILVQVKNKDINQVQKLQYAGFENRDIAFKRVIALWESTVPMEVWKGNKSVMSSNGLATESEEVDIDGRPTSNPYEGIGGKTSFKGLSYKQPTYQLRSDFERSDHKSLDYASQKSHKTIEKNEDFSIRTSSAQKKDTPVAEPDHDYLSQSNAGFR